MQQQGEGNQTNIDQSQVPKSDTSGDYLDAEEYLDSFSALKTSMSQGHDLRKKRKALEEYKKTLETLKSAHADRVNIALDFDALVEEQKSIIADANRAIGKLRKTGAGIDVKIAHETKALAQLKRDQEAARKPLEDELGRRNAIFESTKSELKQAKAQRETLELFDGAADDQEASEAAHDQVVDNIDAKRDAAKSALNEAQKELDAHEKSDRQAQKKAQESIKKLNAEKDKIAREAAELQKKADAASDRIAFCGHVREHPEETETMQGRITENEKTVEEMDAQIGQLASVHKKSKAASTKARTVVIGAIAFVVIVIIVFIVVAGK